MEDPDFEQMALELGFDPSDFDEPEDYYADDSGIGLSQPATYEDIGSFEEDHGGYLEDIDAYSSPSPPERRGDYNRHVGREYGHTQNRVPQGRNLGDVYYEPGLAQYESQRTVPMQSDHYRAPPRPMFPHSQFRGPSQASVGPSHRGLSQVHPPPMNTNYHHASISRAPYNPTPSTALDRQIPFHNKNHAREEQSSNLADNFERRANPRNVHGIRLRPVSGLPDMYRGIFKFGVFNAVQSECFDTVMHSDENMVISAPTGSGKTVLFELAIIRMLVQSSPQGRPAKCIYVAPTKALCSEKSRDWTTKFQSLGINCCELTGDTVQFGKSAWGDARDASVIVTTGEKWDSLTRNWEDHQQILAQIQLFLVDEVHILNESRGSTLEVVVSRMKARGSSVRFVLVSATVPNILDVAAWIGKGPEGGPATVKEFGEDFRPCKLARFVYGVQRRKDQNDFQFVRSLDYRLYGILQQHAVDKPVLVFCSTRKGVITTAEQLLKEYEDATEKKKALPWVRPRRIEKTFHDKKLEKLAVCGIGVHHAGMTMDDRRATEDLYLNKILRVVVATSTLAVGVNLPAHTVVIKGVKIFQNNLSQEYSDLDVMQMMGRAGRPQFDKEGIAIILCEQDLEAKYKALVQGKSLLESCLHLNLSEHINSEIGLRTITDVNSAKEWLHNSFLFQRIQKNPKHYAIGKQSDQTWQEKIDEMVTNSIKKLQANELVEKSDDADGALCSTGYGDIMSKYYIRQSTMSLVLKLPERATLREMLETISASEEFSDIKIRGGEKPIYNKLKDQDEIRFKVKKIEKAADKIFLIIQAILGGINLNDSEYKNGDNQPSLEALTIFRHISRVTRALVEVAILRKSGAQVKYGMELLRCLSAKAWEDRPTVLRQIEQIGEKSIKVLTQFGITSLNILRKQDTLRIEQLLNRRPPFGNEVLASVKQLPQYKLKISEVNVVSSNGEGPVEVEISVECGLENEDIHRPKKNKSRGQDMTLVLTVNSDLKFIDFRRIPTRALKGSKTFHLTAELTKPSQSIMVQITSESIAGIAVTQTYKPVIAHNMYPTLNTRPQNPEEMEAAALEAAIEGDPDFWDLTIDDEDDVPMKDLTRSPKSSSKKVTSVNDNKCLKGSTKSKVVDRISQSIAPKRLPNGNYECNHNCKDKTKCLHFCCRDGTTKPPSLSKKRLETVFGTNDSEKQSSKSLPKASSRSGHREHSPDSAKAKSKSKPKSKSTDKPDSRLQHLESLHASTNVQGRLQFSENQRIKLDDGKLLAGTKQPASKRRDVPKFDLDLVDLKDGEPSILTQLACLDDSDSDLPETRQILQAYEKPKGQSSLTHQDSPSSETNYSNPEFDALICGMRYSGSPQSSPALHSNELAPLPYSSTSMDINMGTPYRKRAADDVSESPLAKRSKLVQYNSSVSRSVKPQSKPHPSVSSGELSHFPHQVTHGKPLFIRDSPGTPAASPTANEDFFAPRLQRDEDFVLDTSLFDIRPASQSSDFPSGSQHHNYAPINIVTQDPPANAPTSSMNRIAPDTYRPEDDGPGAFDDDLAALEAWLQSDAVVIVDKLD